jgi:hypothetical protein
MGNISLFNHFGLPAGLLGPSRRSGVLSATVAQPKSRRWTRHIPGMLPTAEIVPFARPINPLSRGLAKVWDYRPLDITGALQL